MNDSLSVRIPSGLPGGVFVYESGGEERLTFADDNVVALFGCESYEDFYEYVGGSFPGMVHPEDLIKIQNQIKAQTSFEKRHDYVRYRITTKQGQTRYIEDFGHLLHRADGKSYFYVFIVDVDQNEYFNRCHNSFAENEVLSANQDVDPLTGLFNMAFFYQKVQMLLASPEGRRQTYSIVHFDIPNFKLYNERLGFRVGDELLCSLARVIGETFKDGVCSRFSNDHFVVCTPTGKEGTIVRVETVCRSMLRTDDAGKRVRVKAGIYCIDDRMTELGLACDHARLACNSIKGRHDVYCRVYDELIRERLHKQQYVTDHIEKAIMDEYIKVYYQPVVRVRTDEICGYEALVRWIDPEVGTLSPGDFIDTLEQFHLIHLVDQYVIRRVCEDYCALVVTGQPVVPVSINISRLDFELCDIFEIIEQMREEYNVPREMLDLEITESALNDNTGHIKAECDRMRRLGYHLWLDDFGSGYSSLNTLAEFSFDVLKLDLIFLRNYDHNPKTRELMRYIEEGAKGMGLSPLCEGVETAEHYAFLKEIGVERAQGFYFGKPMPMEESRAFTSGKGLKWEKAASAG